MKDPARTNQKLIEEISILKQKIKKLEKTEAKRNRAEEVLRTQIKAFSQVLNGIDALIYVTDMKTYEIIFVNTYGQNVWGDIEGKICWQAIQEGQAGPCEFCTNSKLIGPDGSPTEGVVWEFQNTVNKRWYNCRDRAIYWPDGRMFRIEIATDITDRKSVERTLAEEHQRLSSILDGSPVSSFVIDCDRRVTAWNMVNEFFTGISKEDILGKPLDLSPLFKDRVPPSLADLVLEMTDEEIMKRYGHKGIRMSEIHPQAFESTGPIWIKGKEHIMAIQATRLRDAAGNVIGAIQCAQDITNQKRIEEKLSESENKYRQIVETANEGIWVIDEVRITAFVNPQMAKILGYAQEEMIGKHITFFMFPEDLPASEARMEKRVKGIGGQYEQKFRHKNGHPIWCFVSAQSRIDEKGTFLGAFAMLTNITERRRAEEALRQSEEKYRDIFDKSVGGIYRTTLTGHFVILSPSFAKICGYASPEEMMEKVTDIEDQLYANPEDRVRFQKLIAAEGEVTGFEVQFKHPTNGLVWISINSKALCDEQGNIQYYDGSIGDITDRKRMEEELINHRIQLEELVKERTKELEIKTRMLEDINTALKVLLQQRNDERQGIEDRFALNVKTLIFPYIEKMKSAGMDKQQKSYLSIMESNLNELMSPLVGNMRNVNFTPKEIMVASLIKDGKTTKDIAETMGVGTSAIDSHRNRIRKKLGLNKRNANLQSYLHSLK